MNKMLEAVYAGAVLAKIFVLMLHRRVHPEASAGLFALKGRSAES